MTDAEKREAARQFYQKWVNKGKEKQDDQSYWFDFLQNIMGVQQVTDRIEFQKEIIKPDGNKGWIDAYIPETKVLIEQKSLGVDLSKPQQGHDGMTPYEQAKMYDNCLPVSAKSRWIIVSNFREIWVYDMDTSAPEPQKFSLEELQAKYSVFEFLINQEQQTISQEMEISVKAGEFVGLIYDALLKQYHDPENEESLKSLNMLCVRLVFCLYAEDAKIFGSSGQMFHDYIEQFDTQNIRKALKELFLILDTPEDKRDPYDTSLLSQFPYVNGGLFAKEDIEIPNFTDEIRDILLAKASEGFDWSMISPTIFGAVFESTLNPETRHSGGMHYTSIENIHKVIDPLFMNDLEAEFEEINSIQVGRTKKPKLESFQNKLATLIWLDPACGSGNFLTETYISIRRLENKVIEAILNTDKKQVDGQHIFVGSGSIENPIKVNINQFYGIEINDFAVTVAKTALWIAESQMMKETEDIIHMNLDFLPLTTNANICEENALDKDWKDVVPIERLKYIMGNPPFLGKKEQSKEQKAELIKVFSKKTPGLGTLDYVSGWYAKAAELCTKYPIKCAFVSTNSITQGEQVPVLWKYLYDKNIHIDFAYTTFRWDSEASIKAHVHCIIIGFSNGNELSPTLYIEGEKRVVTHINGYLMDAPDVFLENRKDPISPEAPHINYGSFALDDGNYTIDENEYADIIAKDPDIKRFLPLFIGANEMIKGKNRYCLWLKDATPKDIMDHPIIREKVEKVREWRRKSDRKTTVELADTPTLFAEIRQPIDRYLAIPTVCSGNRRILPMRYYESDVIASNQLYVIENCSLYHFGILTSNVHMAWMRVVAGRLKSDYRYSSGIVYNNFPWPSPTDDQRKAIENTAQQILDARSLSKYNECTLANFYDSNGFSAAPELSKAHTENDRAVMKAYGFNIKDMSEADCVAELMKMYQQLTAKEK